MFLHKQAQATPAPVTLPPISPIWRALLIVRANGILLAVLIARIQMEEVQKMRVIIRKARWAGWVAWWPCQNCHRRWRWSHHQWCWYWWWGRNCKLRRILQQNITWLYERRFRSQYGSWRRRWTCWDAWVYSSFSICFSFDLIGLTFDFLVQRADAQSTDDASTTNQWPQVPTY